MTAATVVQVLQDLFYVLLHVLFYLWSLLKCLRATAAVVGELFNDLTVDFISKAGMFTAGCDDSPDTVQRVFVWSRLRRLQVAHVPHQVCTQQTPAVYRCYSWYTGVNYLRILHWSTSPLAYSLPSSNAKHSLLSDVKDLLLSISLSCPLEPISNAPWFSSETETVDDTSALYINH